VEKPQDMVVAEGPRHRRHASAAPSTALPPIATMTVGDIVAASATGIVVGSG